MGLEISGATTSIVGAATGLAKSVSNLFGGNTSGLKLPSPNILSGYASYDYIISLSALTKADINFPDISYKAGKVLPIICKSAGSNPDNRVQTAYGKYDFYVDQLSFESIIGLASGKNTSVTTVQFDVFEPYSIGTFVLAMQTAAYDAGYGNFRECPYLLTIEFRGNTETGAISNIPFAARHIPIRLTTISLKASEQGSRYNVSAYATQGQALTAQFANLRTDVTIKGTTVQEVLQTGEQSLQVVLNKKLEEYVANDTVAVADKIVILFPKPEALASGQVAAVGGTSDKPTSATSNPKQITSDTATIAKKIGISEKTLAQSAGAVNILGAASMGYNMDKRGDTPGSDETKVVDAETGSWSRGSMVVDPTMGTLRFPQTTDIPAVIDQVLRSSAYPETALAKTGDTAATGFIKWWRIDTQVYIIDSDENLSKIGTYPRIVVYRVVPYDAHASKTASVNEATPGIDLIKKQVVKRYDYIYTGKNTEIIKFNIDFSIGFANQMAADRFKNSQDIKDAAKAGSKENKQQEVKPVADGIKPPRQAGSFGTQNRNDWSDQEVAHGGGQETNANRAARVFHYAITQGKDMLNLELDIWGDPYWIVNSGMGNYTAKPVLGVKDLHTDGSVNYQSGQVHIWLYFRSPLDINQTTGMYDFKSLNNMEDMTLSSKAAPTIGFSGLYVITSCTNSFNKGQFRQTLKGYRVNGSEFTTPPKATAIINVNNPATPTKS